jgi:isopentenyl-diphosphate delta-isomerase
VSVRASDFYLAPEALPEFAATDVETCRSFLGRKFSLPFLITGMTGGVNQGQRINEILACAAERWNIPMGLGSQKMMIKDPAYRNLFDARKIAPSVFLIGNIGAVSFNYGISADDVARMTGDLRLDACAVHLNALQESVQPEGERNFSGLLAHIEKLVRTLAVPVIVKEVGSGMTAETCRRIFETGVAAVDVGGHGGTSWSVIEGHRGDRLTARLGELFRNWGCSTTESIAECSKVVRSFGDAPARQLIATGGIRDGAQAALMLALGADMCGVGLPFFRAVVNPANGLSAEESLDEEITFFARSLETAMFCSGARRIADLSARMRRRVSV